MWTAIRAKRNEIYLNDPLFKATGIDPPPIDMYLFDFFSKKNEIAATIVNKFHPTKRRNRRKRIRLDTQPDVPGDQHAHQPQKQQQLTPGQVEMVSQIVKRCVVKHKSNGQRSLPDTQALVYQGIHDSCLVADANLMSLTAHFYYLFTGLIIPDTVCV